MTNNSRECADLLDSLNRHRFFLIQTAQGLTDDQAREQSSPPSELTLGGLIKHVSATEAGWIEFAETGAMSGNDADMETMMQRRKDEFTLLPHETLAGVLADYEQVAARTNALVESLDLDADHPLPEAPWFQPGTRWSNRRVFLHVIAETSQHAGHADFLRDAIDGQKTMG